MLLFNKSKAERFNLTVADKKKIISWGKCSQPLAKKVANSSYTHQLDDATTELSLEIYHGVGSQEG